MKRARETCRIAAAVLILASAVLTQPLKGAETWFSLSQLRFSLSGQYILAQDNDEITVLASDPLAILFRIPVKSASTAEFTPDGREIVFVNSTAQVDPQRIVLMKSPAQVEHWSIAHRRRVSATILPSFVCGSQGISRDGHTWGCLDLESTLRIVDLRSGEIIFEKKEFTWLFSNHDDSVAHSATHYGRLGSADFDFSPDGRFVIVTPRDADGTMLAWDTKERHTVKLGGPLRQLQHHSSTFISNDQILMMTGTGSTRDRRKGVIDSKLMLFPSGRVLSEQKIPGGEIYPAADPGFIIVRPFGGHYDILGRNDSTRSAAAELRTGLVIVSETPALDVARHWYVVEREKGMVGLYEIGKGLKASISLHPR